MDYFLRLPIRLLFLVILVYGLFGIVACGSNAGSDTQSNTATTTGLTGATASTSQALDSININDTFRFRMDRVVGVHISADDKSGAPVIGARFNVCDVDDPVVETSNCLASGITNVQGEWHTEIKVARHVTELKVVSNFIGLPHTMILRIEEDELHHAYTLGSGNPQAQIPPEHQRTLDLNAATLRSGSSTPSSLFNYLANYNSVGLPDNLEPTGDTISADLLYDINISLPEHTPVFTSNPHYIEDGVISNVVLQEAADVCVTYVHEAAWFENALGYYTYNQSNPPQSANDLTYHMVFPNLSDWVLSPGNQVCLGNFPANTVIGWFLAADAWQYKGHDTIGDGYHIVHTDKALNPEGWDDAKHHTVLLHDPYRDRLILGLEDLRRDNQGLLWNDYPWASDHDFNDAIFSVKATPASAVDTSNLKKLKSATLDRDADGVPDATDAYPDDPDKAFNNYSPSPTTWASLAFEDQ